MAELHLARQYLGTGACRPHDERLGQSAVLDRCHDGVLGCSADFTQTDKHLDVGILLVAEQMVEQAGAGMGVSADGDAFIHAVCGT